METQTRANLKWSNGVAGYGYLLSALGDRTELLRLRESGVVRAFCFPLELLQGLGPARAALCNFRSFAKPQQTFNWNKLTIYLFMYSHRWSACTLSEKSAALIGIFIWAQVQQCICRHTYIHRLHWICRIHITFREYIVAMEKNKIIILQQGAKFPFS